MIHTQVYGFFQTCLPDQAKFETIDQFLVDMKGEKKHG